MGLKSDLMNDLIQGLKGDQQAMERWALAKDSSWRMELVAMLHQAGRLRWPPEKLLDGLALAAPGTVACRDQQWLAGRPCEWPNWTEWCLDLKRSRLWQAAWHHLPTFSMSERVELTLIAFTRVGPEAWDRLAAWLPCRQEVPDHLWQRLQAMASSSRRLKAWMESIARQTDS